MAALESVDCSLSGCPVIAVSLDQRRLTYNLPSLITMSWLLRVTVPTQSIEAISSKLWDAGTSGIAELPDPGDSDQQVMLVAGFETEAGARSAADAHPEATVEPLDPFAWEGPPTTEISIAGSLIRIDAQQAFGHGEHATTQLVIDTLLALVGRDSSFLDVGAGSGVLAIAAKKLGADRVVAIDNDPTAIQSAIANAESNGVSIEVSDTGLAELRTEHDPFDLVVANMLLADLRPLADSICKLVGETLVLSGFLEDQADEVTELFTPLLPVSRLDQGGWVCVVLR